MAKTYAAPLGLRNRVRNGEAIVFGTSRGWDYRLQKMACGTWSNQLWEWRVVAGCRVWTTFKQARHHYRPSWLTGHGLFENTVRTETERKSILRMLRHGRTIATKAGIKVVNA